ncbi:chorismate lyase [Lysobacter sp. yr284]|nr:chorismate lyase [Lysobacter sp. yr284]
MNPDLLARQPALSGAGPASSDSRPSPVETAPSQRLADYLALQGSTTFFLQTFCGHPVEVEVLHQCVQAHPGRGDVLHRHSRLYVQHARNIILVAESQIALSRLDPGQRRKLIDGTHGIGKLLDPGNRGLLEKGDIEVSRVPAPRSLQTASDWAVSRYFALKLNGERCGEIREILNNESLERAR